MKTLPLPIIVISLILIGASNFSTAHVAIPQISTSESNFTDGDIIPINGYALPNSTINIFLVNNYGNIQNSTQVKSNNTGYFNTSLGIPSHVAGGAWALFATNGESNFAMQLMVNFHGSNTPPFNFPSGLPPLKQFKLGIKPSYVQCRSDLQLIIKSENGSPVCVKLDTEKILIERGWALTRLSVNGLHDVYSMGKRIHFIIDYQGILRYCDHPDVSVLDSNQNIVWNSQDMPTTCVPPPYIPFLPGVDQSFDLNSEHGGPMIINKTGNYILKVSLDGSNIERGFSVK